MVVLSQEERHPCRIRPFAPADVGFLVDLAAEVFSRYGPYDRILPHWLPDPAVLTLMAELPAGAPVGFVMVELVVPVAQILAIAVRPDFQGRGVGKALVAAAEAAARAKGLRRMRLCTAVDNFRARGLFQRAGYRWGRHHPAYYPAGQEAVELVKELGGSPANADASSPN